MDQSKEVVGLHKVVEWVVASCSQNKQVEGSITDIGNPN